MEQEQKSTTARQGLILLVVLVGVIISIILIIFVSRKPAAPLPDLSQYLPKATVVALRADRASVMQTSNRFIDSSAKAKDLVRLARTFWTKLESRLGLRAESVLIVISEDRGIVWQRMLFTTHDRLTDAESARIGKADLTDLALPLAAGPLHFQRISDHVGALRMADDTQNYSSPSNDAAQFLLADPISLYLKRPYVETLFKGLSLDAYVPGIEKVIAEQDKVRFGLKIERSLLRVTWPTESVAATTYVPLRVGPATTFAFSGDIEKLLAEKATTTNPFAVSIRNFINQKASQSSFDSDDLATVMKKARAFMIDGSDWLLVGDDTASMTDLVSIFIGAESPKRVVSTLPDKSPYREIVRGLPKSNLELWNGQNLTVWTAPSSTATSTASRSRPQSLYMAERQGLWYLSSSKDLLTMQFGGSSRMLEEQGLLQACSAGISGQGIEVGSSLSSGTNGTTANLGYILVKTTENKGISAICVQ